MITLKELKEQFPHIAFNDDPKKRTKEHYLFQLDTAPLSPETYNIKNIKLYKGVITWNPKVFNQLISWGANAYKISEYPRFNDYARLNEFTPIEEKDGACVIQHDVTHEMSARQTEVFIGLHGIPHFAYGKDDFGGRYHKGELPSQIERLRAIDKHKFAICFENVYHPLWSHNYISERIFNCFKAKTIPVYLGAYNVDDIIPANFYIDYRDFRNIEELSEYLMSFDMEVYEEVTNASYEWALMNQWNPGKLVAALNKLPRG